MSSEVVDPEQPKLLSFGRALNKDVSVFFFFFLKFDCNSLEFGVYFISKFEFVLKKINKRLGFGSKIVVFL